MIKLNLNGWQFLKAIGEDKKLDKIPIVVCSAATENLPKNVPIVTKPINHKMLLQVAQKYCTGPEHETTKACRFRLMLVCFDWTACFNRLVLRYTLFKICGARFHYHESKYGSAVFNDGHNVPDLTLSS